MDDPDGLCGVTSAKVGSEYIFSLVGWDDGTGKLANFGEAEERGEEEVEERPVV